MARAVHVADRLLDAIDRLETPACVGIDPVLERLPEPLRPETGGLDAAADAIRRFGEGVIDAVADHVPAVKLQSACFERFRGPGVAALDSVAARAAARGLVVIIDAKRGDIGLSASHYAAATFEAAGPAADWITVNGYLGPDGIEPFVAGGGAFVLVRTSNPGGDAVQSLELAGGGTVAEAVGAMVASLGEGSVGERGYSAVGAVVAATRPEAAAALRAAMPRQIFLVPGFGAQGGGVDDVLPCFDRAGRGALVTASRSVTYAFEQDPGSAWTDAVARAAGDLAAALRRALAP